MSILYPALRFVGHQHWIPHGRDRFIRLFANPDSNLDYPFDVDFFGARYRGNLSNFIDWTVYFYGAMAVDELFLMRDIADHLRASGREVVGYDIGANIGHHTLFMSLHMDRVVAFEPFEKVRRMLDERLALNRRDNVAVMPFALGDENAVHRYFPPSGANMGTGSLVVTAERERHAGEAIEVETRRGDDLVAAGEAPLPDILKIDVEGYEPRVLAGLADTLRKQRPFMLMELLDEARDQVRDEAGLRALLYDGAELFVVAAPPGRRDYALTPFDFDRAFEILVAPRGAVDGIPALRARKRSHV